LKENGSMEDILTEKLPHQSKMARDEAPMIFPIVD
jgi:hypothetical protein